jgi:hypothetical protein
MLRQDLGQRRDSSVEQCPVAEDWAANGGPATIPGRVKLGHSRRRMSTRTPSGAARPRVQAFRIFWKAVQKAPVISRATCYVQHRK